MNDIDFVNFVFTVTEVAKIRGCSDSYIRRLCREGFWDETESRFTENGVWLISNPNKNK